MTDDRGRSTSTTKSVTVRKNADPVAAFSVDCTALVCSFDGSASSDPDGDVASYAWTFGDGTSGTGRTTTHTYAMAGTYDVTLTVTDNDGAKSSKKTAVTVALALNQPPVAEFTHTCDNRACDFDGSGSSDPDGTIASYEWDFGDGGTASTATANHTYAADGSYQVTLTVTDNNGKATTAEKTVAVSTAPNKPPVAAFTSSPSGSTVAFDASDSSDSDGTIASYAWKFGDGDTGTGKTPSHTYAGTGAYSVTLTVTDNAGASTSLTKRVVVGSGIVVADAFDRNVTRWGSADQGGAYTYSGSTFATNGETGTIQLGKAGVSATASLSSVSARDVNLVSDVSLDSVATGAGMYTSFVVRKVGTSDYRLALQHLSGGKVKLTISKTVGGTSTSLRSVSLTDLTYGAGDVIRVRFQVAGNGTTTLAAKAWKAGTAEPTSAQATVTDNTAELQSSGSFSVIGYLSATATAVPVVGIDNLLLTTS